MSEADAMWEAFLADERDRLPLLALADWHEERGEVNSAYWVRWLANSNRGPEYFRRYRGDMTWDAWEWMTDSGISAKSTNGQIPTPLFDRLSSYSKLVRVINLGESAARYDSQRQAWDDLRSAMSQCPPPVAADNRAAVAQS